MTSKQKKEAKALMKHNKAEKLYMTADGKFFLVENTANNHSLREHGRKREKALKVTKVTADMLVEDTKENKPENK